MKKKALYFLFMIFTLLSISFCISAEMLGGNKLIEWEGDIIGKIFECIHSPR